MKISWLVRSTGRKTLVVLAVLAGVSCVGENSQDNATLEIDSNRRTTPVSIADLDGDGIPDNADDDVDGDGLDNLTDFDDDNDGIRDSEDEMKFDPTESRDYDRDGIGDNADTDDDNDGVVDIDNIHPQKQLCSLQTDLSDSNECLIDLIQGRLSGAVVDAAQVAYIPYLDTIYKLDLKSKRFLSPLKSTDRSDITALRYSAVDERIYIGHSSGLVEYIEGDSASRKLIEMESSIGAIVETPDWLIVRDNIWTNLLDKNGRNLNQWAYSRKVPNNAKWNNNNQSLVWLDNSSYWETVVMSRKISATDDPESKANVLENSVDASPFVISPDGTTIVSRNGNLIDGNSLAEVGSLPSEESRIYINAFSWTALNGLVMQSMHWLTSEQGFVDVKNFFKVEQFDTNYNSKNSLLLEGDPKALLQAGDIYFSIYERNTELWIESYRPE